MFGTIDRGLNPDQPLRLVGVLTLALDVYFRVLFTPMMSNFGFWTVNVWFSAVIKKTKDNSWFWSTDRAKQATQAHKIFFRKL